MDKLTVKIDLTNDAFQEGNLEAELARILRKMASEIEAGVEPEILRDVNGNKVGTATFEN